MTTEEQDLYWAAGYFDARGGYYFKTSQVTILFTDRDLEVLTRFSEIIGHGWIRPSRNSNTLQVSAQADVLAITERFRPLVTRRKLMSDMDLALLDKRIVRAIRDRAS